MASAASGQDEPTFTFTFPLRTSDLLAADRLRRSHTPALGALSLTTLTLIGSIVALLGFGFMVWLDELPWWVLLVLAAYFAIVRISPLARLTGWLVLRRAGRPVVTITIGTESLDRDEGATRRRFPWSEVDRVLAGNGVVAFYRKRMTIALVPDAAFSSRAERDAVLALATRHRPARTSREALNG